MRISTHISYEEATRSSTAIRKGIDNTPNNEQLANMALVAFRVFEPLRAFYGVPIAVNSFFRSVELNRAVGGSSSSQHCKGQAIDIDDTLGGVTNRMMFEYIKDNLEFDQLIWEFGDMHNPAWVHFSYDGEHNRGIVLRASSLNGKTVYSQFDT